MDLSYYIADNIAVNSIMMAAQFFFNTGGATSLANHF